MSLKQLLIRGMTREELIDYIKRKDIFYSGERFTDYSDQQVRDIAKRILTLESLEKLK